MSFHNHEHNHSHAHSTNTRILRVSLAVIAGFMLVEAAGGWLSGSLALLSDAGHMFSDAASLALALFAFKWADLAASAAVALLIGKSGWGVLSGSLHILMEGAPKGTDLVKIAEDIQKINGILGVHDLHAWTITSKKHAMSCHVIVHSGLTVAEADALVKQVQDVVQAHGIGHITVQTEPADSGAACCQACEQTAHEHEHMHEH